MALSTNTARSRLLLVPAIAILISFSCALVIDLGDTGLAISSSQNKANMTVTHNAHCTIDDSWKIQPFNDIGRYDSPCQQSMALAIAEIGTHGLDTEIEFLDRNADAQTTKPKIQLPRKYIASMFYTPITSSPFLFLATLTGVRRRPWLPSCTVAIAMIGSLSAGDPLPGQPPGAFGLSDVMTPRAILWGQGNNIGTPFVDCLRGSPNPALGWTQTGKSFFFGTGSEL